MSSLYSEIETTDTCHKVRQYENSEYTGTFMSEERELLERLYDWDSAPVICELNGYKWVLGPEHEKKLNWQDAVEWCHSVGGELPPRDVLLQAYFKLELKSRFASNDYWSFLENNSNNAWYQNFNNDNQYNNKKYTLPVRAVRVYKILADTKELLAQPELQKREPVSDEELNISTQGMSEFSSDMFKAGFRSAERYYLELISGEIE